LKWTPPQEFDGYRLVRLIGRGRMGQVYLAHDTVLERPVAVKFIAPEDPDFADPERFLTEARAVARLQHPNVVAIFRIGEVLGWPYLVSEFVRGQALNRVAKPVPWERALRLAIGLARGLAAAHRSGVLHRDLKPANAIMTEDGDVKLLDFGLAKLVRVAPIESSGQIEIIRSEAPTARVATTVEDGESPVEATWSIPVAVEPVPAPAPTATHARSNGSGGHALPTLPEGGGAGTDLTRRGIAVGTPLYMAPEVWRGHPASYRSDVYSLGAVLYHLIAGRPPHEEWQLEALRKAVLSREPTPLAEVVPSCDRRLASVLDRCLARDPTARYASGDQLREALEQLTPEARAARIPEGNPYRGLSAFEAEHRALFFGRDPEIRAILERLRGDPFVLVAGDSGVGKSSLCRAGVLPAVLDGALLGRRTWQVVTLVPGRRPLTGLCAALARDLRLDEERLHRLATSEHGTLARELRRSQGGAGGLLLFIDQLEELCTLSEPDEAQALAQALGWLAGRTPGVRLLATVRGDFLTSLAALPGLGDEIGRALYLLRPPQPDAIREAIIGPARAKATTFESDALVQALVESTARTEGGLPLLQFALAELWENRDPGRQTIPLGALEKIGGVAGALARHADGVLLRLLPAQRAAARRILCELVSSAGTRARRGEDELLAQDPSMRAALEALVRGRLLVVREAMGGPVYEVAHEALVQGWPTLRRWLDESAELRALRERLAAAVAEWERLGRSAEALWSARQLAELAPVEHSELGQAEAAFVAASRRKLRKSRLLRGTVALAVPVVVALVYGLVWQKARRDLDRKIGRQLGEAEAALTLARTKDAVLAQLRKESFAQFDGHDSETAERTWGRAQALSGEVEQIYARANEATETALLYDGSRSEVRGLLADLLLERALRAERDGQIARRDELVHRMALYDDDERRRRRFAAPAVLALESTPARAEVTVEEFVADDAGRQHLVNQRRLGTTPLAEVTLPPGSYVLTLDAPGRARVRLPVLLVRAERLPLRIELPVAPAVPEGYVYVPPGRFLVGSTADDSIRRGFFHAAPLHETTTGGYLIARYETTYAAWLEYLRALPPDERARRMPRGGTVGFHGALALKQLSGDVWQLTLQPNTTAYTVRTGQPLRYAGRAQHASHDWLKLPVSGISADDAEAYATWLGRSGKLRGARLCSEYEWERAARGADGREYPHGNRLEGDDANFHESGATESLELGPNEVGTHPRSRSPFGLDDMSGNVWEWTISTRSLEERVARGGSYFFADNSSRAPNREILEHTFRDVTLGMRVCASFPAP
jgi:serine/threonine protein kinase/formylglycine-generating enzyme required for sulfatase activity